MDEKKICSISLIHSITNDQKCYVKIKNRHTNEYIKYNSFESQKLNPYKNPCVHGSDIGTIFVMIPTYTKDKFNLFITDNFDEKKYDKTILFDGMLCMCSNGIGSLQQVSREYKNITNFMLSGNFDKIRILTNDGNNYMYMTSENNIFNDGDSSCEFMSDWIFEKLNEQHDKYIRHDQLENEKEIVKKSYTSISQLNSEIFKTFVIMNKKYKKYLNVTVNINDSYGRVYGGNEHQNFIITTDEKNERIYIYTKIGEYDKYLYTIPENNDVYIGLGKNNWCKFYIVKKIDHYLLRGCHIESDKYGNIGKFLRMNEGDTITSDGNIEDESSFWIIK